MSGPTTTKVQRARNALVATLYKQQLGAVIRRRREALGLTQRQLADRVSISEAQTVSRWERGERAPTDLDAVARGLETSTEELLAELEPLGQRQRRTMDTSELTQLDRVEHKLDRVLAALDEQAEEREALASAATELRAALVGDAAAGLQRTREQASPGRRGTGR